MKTKDHIFPRASKYTPLVDRINSRIYYSTDGCWYWLGATDRKGYARHGSAHKKFRVYRFMYEQKHGIKLGNLCACHHCDNRLCVNPDHIFPGTIKDNNHDMIKKGRHKMPITSKLTPSQALEIRNSTKPRKELVVEFGISHATISRIKNKPAGKAYYKLLKV